MKISIFKIHSYNIWQENGWILFWKVKIKSVSYCKGWKTNFPQNEFNWSTLTSAHLTAQTCTAGVVWCGVVWCRVLRVKGVLGGRPALHHPIPDNMSTEGLSTADGPHKKKKKEMVSWSGEHNWLHWFTRFSYESKTVTLQGCQR